MDRQEKKIRLCYRKIINSHSLSPWEKQVWEDTYVEFRMQAQYFNQEKRYTTFREIIGGAKGAEGLHLLVSTAAVGYLRQLGGKIPDITNALGSLFLPFENFRFEIIESDIADNLKHEVALNFYSDPLVWYETIGNQLLVSVAGPETGGEVLTDLVSLQPFLSIYSLQ